MSRDVKRVPMDFDWPMDKVWQGYLMPDALIEPRCETCEGSGVTAARQWVSQIANLLLMLNWDLTAQARGQAMHPYFNDTGSRASLRPSPDIAELAIGLAGRGEPGCFHDAMDGWAATDKVITAAGLDPKKWGMCVECHGAGNNEAYPGQGAEAEAWECVEPPLGIGWQLWETVSEGSPISPVFDSPEALARWMADTPTRYERSHAKDYETALRFVNIGWAPSGVIDSTGVHAGVDAIGSAQ